MPTMEELESRHDRHHLEEAQADPSVVVMMADTSKDERCIRGRTSL